MKKRIGYLHPSGGAAFATLNEMGDIKTASGEQIDCSEYEWKLNGDRWSVTQDGVTRIIRELQYLEAIDGGQAIRMDFSKSRFRKIKANQIRVETIGNDSTNVLQMDPSQLPAVATKKLSDMTFDPKLFEQMKTGTYIDSFFSTAGGINPGINVMVTGDPGVGKSSNLMEILVRVKEMDPSRKVLYISAEMSPIDVKEFEQYYPQLVDIDFLYINEYITNPALDIKAYQALLSVLHQGWDLIVLDSYVEIQNIIQEELSLSAKRAERWLLDLLGTHNAGHNALSLYTTALLIQQKTKGGQAVGSKRLEHMTSAFLELKWDGNKRYMEFVKNRKGPVKQPLYYSFSDGAGIKYDSKKHQQTQEFAKVADASTEFAIKRITNIEELFNNTVSNSIAETA